MYLSSTQAKIYVAGHRGLVGSAVVRRLRKAGYKNLLLPTRQELDLRRQTDVEAFFEQERPDFVVMAAARVGGILANDRFPADFISDNLVIQTNVVRAAHEAGVQRLLFLGSSCIYPKHAPQPLKEDALLTGPLEPTNQWYAVAKIAGVKLCQAYRRQHGRDFVSLMPTNLYGPGDNYDLETSHVLPALIRKTHEAKAAGNPTMALWGSGRPRREFLHVNDLADAVVFLLKEYSGEEHINVGTGVDISIIELADLIGSVVGWEGDYVFDATMPDGVMQKLLDVSRLAELGWEASISLERGIEMTYNTFLAETQ
ncbi:MAG: GDP-L-fucose synthase [Bacteroidetes bacterium]|nr:GDP-L-fucose synthase [Bacteroidota bacterium]